MNNCDHYCHEYDCECLSDLGVEYCIPCNCDKCWCDEEDTFGEKGCQIKKLEEIEYEFTK